MEYIKTKYKEFCCQGYVPLHLQAWWWDAVCGPSGWRAALSADAAGNVYGIWPYATQYRWGIPMIKQPPFTSYAGPWIRYPDHPELKQHSRHTHEKAVLEDLMRQLPRRVFFRQNAVPGLQNALPLQWGGFVVSPRYTYRIADCSDLDACWEGLKSSRRAKIRQAQDRLDIRRADSEWEPLFDLYTATMQRKGLGTTKPRAAFGMLHKALHARRQNAVFTAYEPSTAQPVAALYVAFDHRWAYAILAASAVTEQPRHALDALYWAAIAFCHERGLGFDFEGSMAPAVEHVYRSFGGVLTPYLELSRGFWR